MFMVPLFSAFFFLNLMNEGLPIRIPVGVVDLDQSQLSREMTRALASSQMLDLVTADEDYHSALTKVRNGEIFGFFYIPDDFQRDTYAQRSPTLTFYSNMTYFVPGTLSFKGFKTVAVSTTAGVASSTLMATGAVDMAQVKTLLQPVVVDTHPLGNPWMNYSIYLSNSFLAGIIALMVMLMTAYSILDEVKRGTSPQWLATAGGSMTVAMFGKLLPQTVIWSAIGVAVQSLLYGYCHFPMNCPAWHMIVAMVLLVVGSQALSVMICEMIPNLRFALSINSLIGILALSVAGFSFPVENMYGAVAIFSYILPLRWYFLIYIDQALNGIPLFFSRFYYVALLLFPIISFVGLRRLRGHCENPVYLP